ncbi:DNA-directed RNA polymerase subunit alpha [bacterium]|nr:MAG: DNA-directed RNA polymerase subunit alpha [bacterium]
MEKIIVSCLESRVEANRSIYARFLLGPFTEDYAVTIGTALRRALLSKVKNIAITAIHIQGVTHEFSTIVGVRESVLDLALNFQQIVLRTKISSAKDNVKTVSPNASTKTRSYKSMAEAASLFGVESETAQLGYLQMRGPAVIHANDLKLPLGIECVDPTQYIATLSQEGLLVVKFLISSTKGSLNKNTGALTGIKINESLKNKNELLQEANQNSVTLSGQRYTKRLGKTYPYKCKTNPSVYKSKVFASTLTQNFLQEVLITKASFYTQPKGVDKQDKQKEWAHAKQSLLNGYKPRSESVRGASILQGKYHKSLTAGKEGRTILFRPKSRLSTSNFRSFDSTICLRNTIFLDPIFNSVFQVNYIIEKDDLCNQPRERIILELWTNGSIHPRQAIHQAFFSLISTFSVFRKAFALDSW